MLVICQNIALVSTNVERMRTGTSATQDTGHSYPGQARDFLQQINIICNADYVLYSGCQQYEKVGHWCAD